MQRGAGYGTFTQCFNDSNIILQHAIIIQRDTGYGQFSLYTHNLPRCFYTVLQHTICDAT